MSVLEQWMGGRGLSPCLDDAVAAECAEQIGRLAKGRVYAASVVDAGGRLVALIRRSEGRRLVVVCKGSGVEPPLAAVDTIVSQVAGQAVTAWVFDLNGQAAGLIRQWCPFARPQVLGLATSFGAGDRLGLAGPGHIRAGRRCGKGIRLVLAQQSARELMRTQRTAQEVVDAATWAVLQEGYRESWGADADHLKTPADVDAAAAAGFTMFTIDPGDHVDNKADRLSQTDLVLRYDEMSWKDLETTSDAMWHKYVGITYKLDDHLTLVSETPEDLMRAAVKYGAAIIHTVTMSRHIARVMGDRPFEIEVSVDETLTPTTVFEHFFVATELKRLGVPNVVSLAPRFIGEFEKGIDYKGDLKRFEQTVQQHVVVARHCGPYKLSIHSGSDKFSIYPAIARHVDGCVHVKTAGTSYLEALRVIGSVDPGLFREIYTFACERYEQDRASYHVSADRASLPKPSDLSSEQMPGLLDRPDTRQVFHVTFGSVLTSTDGHGKGLFRPRLLAGLDAHEEEHYAALIHHIGRHMEPFARVV